MCRWCWFCRMNQMSDFHLPTLGFLQMSVFHTYTFLLSRTKTCVCAQVVTSGVIWDRGHWVLSMCLTDLLWQTVFLCIRSGWGGLILWILFHFIPPEEWISQLSLSGYFMAPLLFFIIITPYLWVSLFFLFFYMKSHLWYCSKQPLTSLLTPVLLFPVVCVRAQWRYG